MTVKLTSRIKDISPQLIVASLDKSIVFYTEILGFDVHFHYEDFYCSLSMSGYAIHLKTGKPTPEERRSRRYNDHLDLVFSVEGIDNLFTDLKSKGVKIIRPVQEMPYGHEFYILDPDEYILAFIEPKRV
jgi:catechol 2,3-dioxygenase-like lactoylglutathione lyase family enzyme